MMTGVLKGEVLNIIFFNITLDYILIETNDEIKDILEYRKMLGYVKDLIIGSQIKYSKTDPASTRV